MAFWHRIGQSKLKIFSTQFRRCYIHASSTLKPRPMEMPYPDWVFHDSSRPTYVCNSVRFFAAPVQAKLKKEESDTSGPRINEEIKAQFVRLVMDDGHSIVSRLEALGRARRLKLDLVEVQKNANPPVCKIMDFHKEKYKQQEKEKERSKSKSEVTLRKGDCKEVRFSEKTEIKDLKMKADMVKKLMEKGYRVKCRASGTENQDLQGALSRLSALIEDISVVESGPHLARKEAYMIVRHVKFGPSKKGGGGRKLQEAAQLANAQEGNMEPLAVNSSNSIEYENQNSAVSGFETEEEVFSDGDNHISLSMGRSDENIKDRENAWSASGNNVNRTTYPDSQTNASSKSNDLESPAVTENRYKRADYPRENKVNSTAQVPPPVTENRYFRAEPRNRFQRTTFNNTGPNSRGPGTRDTVTSMPLNLDNKRQVPVDINGNHKTEDTKQAFTPGSRNSKPSLEDIPKRGLSQTSAPNIPRPGYGFFSAPRGPETQGVKAGMHRNREGSSQDSAWQPLSAESK